MNTDLKGDAAKRGETYGQQAAEQMAADIFNGHAAAWGSWQSGYYSGSRPDNRRHNRVVLPLLLFKTL